MLPATMMLLVSHAQGIGAGIISKLHYSKPTKCSYGDCVQTDRTIVCKHNTQTKLHYIHDRHESIQNTQIIIYKTQAIPTILHKPYRQSLSYYTNHNT